MEPMDGNTLRLLQRRFHDAAAKQIMLNLLINTK